MSAVLPAPVVEFALCYVVVFTKRPNAHIARLLPANEFKHVFLSQNRLTGHLVGDWLVHDDRFCFARIYPSWVP